MHALLLALALTQSHVPANGVEPASTYHPNGPKIEFEMANGKTFVITTDPKTSPKTVKHILELVMQHFYNRQRVHRVEDWVTQWGDPLSKTAPMSDKKMGDGGSGHDVPFENNNVDWDRSLVGVASDGLQRGGDSQLFVLKKPAWRLYHSYAVVGKVTKGMDVVDSIKKGDKIRNAWVIGVRYDVKPPIIRWH
ncbi:MAG TPA: peptidylprolyl isomerase [Fimbriimonadaceae bacterium]|jgi:peptidylprolyl isomerase